jgi:hypothetical protein
MNEQLIRDAVAELVAAAPTAKPLPSAASVSTFAPPERSYRWLALAAAAVLLIGGVVAVAAWRASRDTAPATDTLPPALTTAVPGTTVPGTVAPTVPPTTQATPTETMPPVGVTTGITTFDIDPIPSGTFQFGPDDVIATRVDGDLWWYPGLLGDSPGEPVRLLDLEDPREPVTEGPGPNTVSFVAGAINGTLVYGTCCEPVAGDLRLLQAPDGDPYGIPFGYGWDTAISPDGTHMISAGYGFVVYDLAAGTGSVLDDPTTPPYESVAWSPDGSAFALLGFEAEGEWFLETRSAVAPYEVLVRTGLGVTAPPADTDVWFAGWGGDDGTELLLAFRQAQAVTLHPYSSESLEPTGDAVDLPVGTTGVRFDAAGRMLVVSDNQLTLPRQDGTVLANEIADAWFVPTYTVAAPPPDPAGTTLASYFAALADGRYDEAAALLGGGGLEYERRRDLRPLYREFGDVDDLAARLQAWCETFAVCSEPVTIGEDGSFKVAMFRTEDGVATGYFRSGEFEGVPQVSGLPPRRPLPGSEQCLVAGVHTVTEADLDGVAGPETIVETVNDQQEAWVHVCNTPEVINPWRIEGFGESVLLAVVDGDGDGRDELLIGEGAPEAYSMVVVERRGIELVATGAEYRVDYTPLPTTTPNTWSSFGCADVDGVRRLVAYRYELVGGNSIESASSAIVTTVLAESGTDVAERTYQLPAELDAVVEIVDPHCGGLSVLTEG